MLRTEYPNAWAYKVCDRFTSGVPDIIGCLPNGHLFAIELKVSPNKTTKLQDYVLQRIRAAGGIAGVAYSIQDVRKLLREGGDTPCQKH